jgi:predicted nucleic acid-binding Zn ribbon protein
MKINSSCVCCNKSVTGRSDKKFCSDQCRTEYNNQKKRLHKPEFSVNRINRILIHNRLILSKLAENHKMVRVNCERLIHDGFHFNFYTHTIKGKDSLKYFCYDIGYVRKGTKEVVIYTIY